MSSPLRSAFRTFRRLEFGRHRRHHLRAVAQALHRQPRQHRLRREGAALFDVSVALLDQEPLLLALLELHQGPHALELVALELEQELPLRQSLARVPVRDPLALVPHDHRPRPVVARRESRPRSRRTRSGDPRSAPRGACRRDRARGPWARRTRGGPRRARGGGPSGGSGRHAGAPRTARPAPGETTPAGSGVLSAVRLARYFSRSRGMQYFPCPPCGITVQRLA